MVIQINADSRSFSSVSGPGNMVPETGFVQKCPGFWSLWWLGYIYTSINGWILIELRRDETLAPHPTPPTKNREESWTSVLFFNAAVIGAFPVFCWLFYPSL